MQAYESNQGFRTFEQWWGSKGLGSVLCIAEIGNNHNGDFGKAIQLIEAAKDAGADVAKFQVRHISEIYTDDLLGLQAGASDLGVEYTMDLLKRFELSLDQHEKLKLHCDKIGIGYLATPWDLKSADFLESINVEGYKVASADLTNVPLIDHLARKGKPLILSTGMSRLSEITTVSEMLNRVGADFALLHCNSTYPAPLDDINLRFMLRLRELATMVGYSGHERGISVSLGAVALGAQIIERHITLDRSMEGPDHAASLTPGDFKLMVEGIRDISKALGAGAVDRKVSQGELINRENLGKSVVASRNLAKGSIVKAEDLEVRSPGLGLSPLKLDDLVGVELGRSLAKHDFFYPSDLGGLADRKCQFDFERPWGVPVRFHDFQDFTKLFRSEVWEFHLSYRDLVADFENMLPPIIDADLVVHAPELFENSELLDLCSLDQAYRQRSIDNLELVGGLARHLGAFFEKSASVGIVANVGGFSMDSPMKNKEIQRRYDILFSSLDNLDLSGNSLLIQNMAPFPWHFGGQRYQNLFLLPDDIAEKCERYGLNLCLDVSHAGLTCNYFGLSLVEFIRTVGPFVKHIHISDFSGTNGEGLQFGEGQIDLEPVCRALNAYCKNISFIPEIWQGHKDAGAGFSSALQKLEGLL